MRSAWRISTIEGRQSVQIEEYEDAVKTYELLEKTGEGAEMYYKDYAITLAYAGYPESAEKNSGRSDGARNQRRCIVLCEGRGRKIFGGTKTGVDFLPEMYRDH